MKNRLTFAHELIRELICNFHNSWLLVLVLLIMWLVRFPAGCGEPYLFYMTHQAETVVTFTSNDGIN